MDPAHELYKEVLALQQSGQKPFRIVKHVLAKVAPSHVALSGTVNDSRLIFASGEEISFDGSAWHYYAPEPEE
jgi:hypothetical protein